MKQSQVTLLTDLALQKAQAAKDLSTVIASPEKFYVVTDTSVIVPTHYSAESSLQDFIDNEHNVTIFPALNDYIHIETSKVQLSGTVTVGAGETDVVGVGTAFTTELSPGDIISIAAQEVVVDTITDDDNLTLISHHRFGATGSIAFKVALQWWRYTSGGGTQPADYTSITTYDPENQDGVSKSGLYIPDPEKILTDYTANFVDDPQSGTPFEGALGNDDYFQSVVDLKSMYINIVKTAGVWVLGVQVNIILVVDTDGDLFAIIHSSGSDFTSDAEWSLTPEYNFTWASVLEGMIIDSVKRTVEADSTIVQIENSYKTVREIARSMGKNADLVVGTASQNSLEEADHLIDNWIADLVVGSRTRVLFREATHIPDSDWNVTEKVETDFDRDAKLDMTGRILTFANLDGKLVVENAANNSVVITGDIQYLILESDNIDCLSLSGSEYTVIHNGKLISSATNDLDQKIDSAIQGLDPQESIIGIIDFTSAEPATPANGDRYINSATGDSSQTTQAVTANYIYEWNDVDWTEIVPDDKTFLPDESTNGFLVWNTTAWVAFGSILKHNNLSDKNVGDYLHLTAAEYAAIQNVKPNVNVVNYQSNQTLTAALCFAGNLVITNEGANQDIEITLPPFLKTYKIEVYRVENYTIKLIFDSTVPDELLRYESFLGVKLIEIGDSVTLTSYEDNKIVASPGSKYQVVGIGNGYWGGGSTGSVVNEIDGLLFSNDTWFEVTANIGTARNGLAGFNSPLKGYWAGGVNTGGTDVTDIDSLLFSSDSYVAVAAALSEGRGGNTAGVNSIAKGYRGGGSLSGVDKDDIDSILFSNDAFVAVSSTIGIVRRHFSGYNSVTKGYWVAGWPTTDRIDSTLFSNDTWVAVASVISAARNSSACLNSLLKGYIGGGFVASAINIIDSLLFSNDSFVAVSATIGNGRRYPTACNSEIQGYWGGGSLEGGADTNEIDGLLFSNDTWFEVTANIGTARNGLAGVQSGGIL